MQSLHVLILAAGEGKRMVSRQPKLLHPCAGVPLLAHVVRAATALDGATVHVVVAPGADAVREALSDYSVSFAVQEKALGTADAVAAGLAAIEDDTARVLVLNGDCPGVQTSTLERLLQASTGTDAAVLAVHPEDRSGYGRLQFDAEGNFIAIIEEADLQGADEGPVNGGAYVFDLTRLRDVIGATDGSNAQAEHYLTAVFALMQARGDSVEAVPHDDADEVHGVNSRAELARAEALLRRRTVERLMSDGVTFRDPGAVYFDVDVEVGADTVVYPGVTLEGTTTVGTGCELRSQVRVGNSRIGNQVTVLDGSQIDESSVDDDASVGPYARLRPGSDIGKGAKVGNYVETKATRLGNGSKASHLSYLGNARIGDNVNIGAGTITCNYDGVNKHETVIGDGAFIGSNTSLVAPVRVGKNAYVGAGSTITDDIPDDALGIGRGRQVNKNNWANEKDND